MAALNLTEGVTKKLDLILERLSNLDSKMEELTKAVKGLQGKVSSLEVDVELKTSRGVSMTNSNM